MHYFIDGYNVLYALPDMPAGTWEMKRDALLRKIAAEKPHGKNQVTVVFDSREGAGSQSRRADIAIAFTSGETADDWISNHIREAVNPRVYVVVTDDQGLRRLIRGTGAKWLGTGDFWRQAKAVPIPRTAPGAEIDSDSITEEMKKKWL